MSGVWCARAFWRALLRRLLVRPTATPLPQSLAAAAVAGAGLAASLRVRNLLMTDGEVRSLFAALDVNGDGRLSFAEVAAAVMPRLAYLEAPEAAEAAFTALDADRDGEITLRDVLVSNGGVGLRAWAGGRAGARCARPCGVDAHLPSRRPLLRFPPSLLLSTTARRRPLPHVPPHTARPRHATRSPPSAARAPAIRAARRGGARAGGGGPRRRRPRLLRRLPRSARGVRGQHFVAPRRAPDAWRACQCVCPSVPLVGGRI